jgi:hypothetical protein
VTRRRRIDPDVLQALTRTLLLGYSPSSTLRELERDERLSGRLPSLRTIEDMARELRPTDRSEAWGSVEAGAEEAALVLPVLGVVARAGQLTGFTRDTAHWVAQVRRIAPGLDAVDVLGFAIRYQRAAATGQGGVAIDLDLALRLAAERPPG